MKDHEPHGPYAVLMGDLVHSETAPDAAALHQAFNAAVTRQNAQDKAHMVSPLTITLGDEFQGLATNLNAAAKTARDLRFELADHGIECRFVIGRVHIETPINTERAWNMMGHGLAEARTLLNEKKPGLTYRFSLPEAGALAGLLDALGAGLAVIERSWTSKQRRDIRAQINGTSPEALAAERDVTVRSIYKVRKSGEYDAYILQWQAILDALEAHDKDS